MVFNKNAFKFALDPLYGLLLCDTYKKKKRKKKKLKVAILLCLPAVRVTQLFKNVLLIFLSCQKRNNPNLLSCEVSLGVVSEKYMV